MRKALFVLVGFFLVSACQKTAETLVNKSDEPAIFGQSLQCNCNTAVIVPSCCCTITLVASPAINVPFQLCGTTTSPSVALCPGFTPPASCSTLPVGPVREGSTLNLPNNPSYDFCAAQGYVFRVTNTAVTSASFRISCVSSGIPAAVGLTLNGGDSGFVTISNTCQPSLCL